MFDDDFWRRTDEYFKNLDNNFGMLADDCCYETPIVGDRVVFAGGLLGHGHPWVRIEAEVIEIGQSSYKVRWPGGLRNEPIEKWIHPRLVTDVLHKEPKA